MSSGSWNKSSGNLILTKTWNGADTPPGEPYRENNYTMTGVSGIWGGKTQNRTNCTTAPWVDSTNINTSSPSSSTEVSNWANAQKNILKTRALDRAVTGFRGHEFNAAVTLGEGKEVVDLCYNTMSRFVRAGLALRKGNLSAAARLLNGRSGGYPSKGKPLALTSKDAASFWLANRYGFVPLLGDVYNSAEAYRTLVKGRIESGRRAWAGHASAWRVWNGAKYTALWDCPAKLTLSARVKIVTTRDLTWPESLGLTNPLQLAWELLPLSFVFDWAWPVSTHLNLRFGVPLSVQGQMVMSYRTQRTMDGSKYTPKTCTRQRASFWSRYKATTLERTVTANWDLPRIASTPPGDIFNAKRLGDLLALGKVLFSGGDWSRYAPDSRNKLLPWTRI